MTRGKKNERVYTQVKWWICGTCRHVVNDRTVHDRWHNAEGLEWIDDPSNPTTRQTGYYNAVTLPGPGRTSPTSVMDQVTSISGAVSVTEKSA